MGFRSRARVTKSRSIARVVAPPTPQIFSPTGANLVIQGGQVVAGGLNVSPTGAQLVTEGGTPVYGGINARPTGASLVVEGGLPIVISEWTPDLLPGLLAWYDAAAITGKIDGDALASVTDSSGNGHTISQGTGTKQPLYKTAIQNSLPMMRFDGSDDYLISSAFAQGLPFSRFVVWIYRGTVGAVVDKGWDGFVLGSGSSAFYVNYTNSKFGVFGGLAQFFATGPTANTCYISTEVWNSDQTVSVRVNGSSLGTSADCGGPGSNGVVLGAGTGGSDSWAQVDIGEWFMGAGDLSADISFAELYLNTKWAAF